MRDGVTFHDEELAAIHVDPDFARRTLGVAAHVEVVGPAIEHHVERLADLLALLTAFIFFDFYGAYIKRERQRAKPAGGGDFYNNQNTRIGVTFATSVIRAAMEGRLSFKEAYDLTGLRGGAFQQYARRLGMDLP